MSNALAMLCESCSTSAEGKSNVLDDFLRRSISPLLNLSMLGRQEAWPVKAKSLKKNDIGQYILVLLNFG